METVGAAFRFFVTFLQVMAVPPLCSSRLLYGPLRRKAIHFFAKKPPKFPLFLCHISQTRRLRCWQASAGIAIYIGAESWYYTMDKEVCYGRFRVPLRRGGLHQYPVQTAGRGGRRQCRGDSGLPDGGPRPHGPQLPVSPGAGPVPVRPVAHRPAHRHAAHGHAAGGSGRVPRH